MAGPDMSYRWIGLRQGDGGSFDLASPGAAVAPATGLPGMDPPVRGTIRLEIESAPSDSPQNLLRLSMRDPTPTFFNLRLDPDGAIALMMRRGDDDLLVTLDMPTCPAGAHMHVQYGWDRHGGLGYLWAQIPSIGVQCLRAVAGSLGVSRTELERMMTDPGRCRMSHDVTYAAVADGLAPAGPLPGLGGEGVVDCEDGRSRPLAALRRGERIIAADGAPAQVRWTGLADLPAIGRHAPCRINPPYHGARAPLELSGTARLRLDGIEVEYLFGETEVVVQARHLRDNVAILPAAFGSDVPDRPIVRYHHLMLDRPVPFALSGVIVEPLDCSPLRADPDLLIRSVLWDTPPELLSRETAPACKLLREYEAQSLRQMQAA